MKGIFSVRIDLTGRRFGSLTVISVAPKEGRHLKWICKCDCGNTSITSGDSLKRGGTKSCGCKQGSGSYRHGACKTKEYRIWMGMRQRCNNPKASHYDDYGGRGISVCGRWGVFENFLEDMGPIPIPSPSHSIERNNHNGNYEPDNCRWATKTEQQNNMRSNKILIHAGKSMTVAQWSRALGVERGLIHQRLKYGWTTSEILDTPPLWKRRKDV